MNFPGFVAKNFDEKAKFCIRRYPEEWMGKTDTLIWFLCLAFFPVVIMGALYFRVVYTLWFQPVEHSAFDSRQQVRLEWQEKCCQMRDVHKVEDAVSSPYFRQR